MEAVRYGMIGCGDMGRVHAMNFSQQAGLAEAVAICDVNDENIAAMLGLLPNREKVRVVKDYRHLLEMEEVEAVVISTPNNLHYQMVLDSFAAGKHVFCEKPMEVTLQRCRGMIAAWQQSELVFQIGLVYRYSPLFRKMAHLIQEGTIGQPWLAWCQEFRVPFPIGRTREWRYNEATSGGALLEKDCHHFDLFNWLLGVQPLHVQAMGGQLAIKQDNSGAWQPGVPGEPYPASLAPHPEVIDHAWVNIEYENGAKANLGLCFFAQDVGLPFGILGTTGRIESNVAHQTLELVEYNFRTGKPKRTKLDATDKIHGFGEIGHSGGYNQHVEFCQCVRENKQAWCNGNIGIQSLYPAFAAQKSIAEGGRVVQISEILND